MWTIHKKCVSSPKIYTIAQNIFKNKKHDENIITDFPCDAGKKVNHLKVGRWTSKQVVLNKSVEIKVIVTFWSNVFAMLSYVDSHAQNS